MDKYLNPDANYERLLADYRQWGSITVGFDFDDTVYDFHKSGDSYDMVIQLLRDLKEIGTTLVCWTAQKDLTLVINFLTDNDIPFDSINEGGIPLPWESRKPFFSALLDDRAGLLEIYTTLTRLVKTIKSKQNGS